MGRVKNLLTKIINKTKTTIEIADVNPLPANEIIKKKEDTWTLLPGVPLTPEEVLEQNKLLIKSIDYGVDFILEFIDELNNSNVSFRDIFVSDRQIMKLWLAHIAYKNKITSFSNLIRNTTTKKKIKCITDLPLQKKLLN